MYWHANTGAHEVHGGILEAFLRYGGVGKHPVYGKKTFWDILFLMKKQ
ncbi:MAG: hypothetical protein IPL74_11720 [Bacteroidetes bacterium]|nr:hypothetical protein [Bacteroidota bacterium]